MVDPGINNFFTNNKKFYIFLLLGFLVIFSISIVNAVDFRKIAVQNDEISDTYFGVTYANVLFGLNILLAILVFAGIVYVSIKILKSSKELRDLENDLETYRLTKIAEASKSDITPDIFMKTASTKTVSAPDFFSAFGIPAGVGANVETFNTSGVKVNELKEVARLNGIDISKYANSCSDGNKELKCNNLTANDVNLNSLYNKFYE